MRYKNFETYFFKPLTPHKNHVFKVLFYSLMIVYGITHYFTLNPTRIREQYNPVGIINTLSLPMPSAVVLNGVYALFFISMLLCIFSNSRVFRIFAFVMAYYLFNEPYCYGLIFQRDSGALIALGIMIFPNEKESWHIRFIEFYWILILTLSGWNKVFHTGIYWASGDALGTILWKEQYLLYPQTLIQPQFLAQTLLDWKLTRLASFAALLLELSAFLILVHRKYFQIIFWIAILFLICVQFTLGRSFIFSMAPLFIACLPYFWPEKTDVAL